jgi:sortase A
MKVEPVPGSRRRARQRKRLSVVGVLGELFITAGVIVFLFVGWQFGLNEIIAGNEQHQAAVQLSRTWGKGLSVAPAAASRPDPGPPPIPSEPGNAVRFANLIVPRLGATWIRPIAEGIGVDDVLRYGVGHYPGTQMPGQVGNAAFAAHRTGYSSPFYDLPSLQLGDSIYIETPDGWYRYVFRSIVYVPASGVEVLAPVPQMPGAGAQDRIITLTSCNPVHTALERVVAYGIYDTWYPRAGGPPAEIAALVKSEGAG